MGGVQIYRLKEQLFMKLSEVYKSWAISAKEHERKLRHVSLGSHGKTNVYILSMHSRREGRENIETKK